MKNKNIFLFASKIVNMISLKNNLYETRKVSKSPLDFFKHILMLYSSGSFLSKVIKKSMTINYLFDGYLGDIKLTLRNNSGSDIFIFSEVFQHKYYDISLPFSPNTILDLGGNIGLSALYFSKKYRLSSIAVVEPMENNLTILRSNLANNMSDIVVFPVAIACEDSVVNIRVEEHDYDHHIVSDDEIIDYQDVVKVEAKSIHSIMSTLGWNRINFLKIDIEGYEKILLGDGADWLTLVDALCIEIHGDYYESDLIVLAELYGFHRPSKIPGGLWLMIKENIPQ